MNVVAKFKQDRFHIYNEKDISATDYGKIWQLVFCPVCSGISLMENIWIESSTVGNMEEHIVVYPSIDNSFRFLLPPEIEKAHRAAMSVRYIDSNAFAVLIGRVLDKICVERKAIGNSLYDRLNSLAEKEEIPKKLVDMLHQLRHLRNIGAHADIGELTRDEVPILYDLYRAILEYIYVVPYLVQRVEKKLKELKRR